MFLTTRTARKTLVLTAVLASTLVSTACSGSESATPAASSVASSTSTSVPVASTQPAGTATGEAATDATSAAPAASASETTGGAPAQTPSAASSTDGTDPVTMRRLGVTITAPEQVATKLAGTTDGFQAYIQDLARASVKEQTEASCKLSLAVDDYWADDQAMGSLTNCGGYSAIWFVGKDGNWQEMGFQGALSCDEMRAKGVPHAIPASTGFTCTVGEGSKQVQQPYTPA